MSSQYGAGLTATVYDIAALTFGSSAEVQLPHFVVATPPRLGLSTRKSVRMSWHVACFFRLHDSRRAPPLRDHRARPPGRAAASSAPSRGSGARRRSGPGDA